MDEQTARREIVRVGKLMYERSYVVSSDGNVSVRLDDGRVVATPTQTCKGRMTEDSLAVTDIEGKALNERRASSELARSEEHTSELQSQSNLVCRLLLEKKKKNSN